MLAFPPDTDTPGFAEEQRMKVDSAACSLNCVLIKPLKKKITDDSRPDITALVDWV